MCAHAQITHGHKGTPLQDAEAQRHVKEKKRIEHNFGGKSGEMKFHGDRKLEEDMKGAATNFVIGFAFRVPRSASTA